MPDTPVHDLRSDNHIEAIHHLKEYLRANQAKPFGLRLSNSLAVIGVASILEKNGWRAQKYRSGSDQLVLGLPPGYPPLSVWFGQGGWKARRVDDLSNADAPEPTARLVSEIRPGKASAEASRNAARAESESEDPARMTAIIINGDSMGCDNSEAGPELLLTYFDTLTAMAAPPEIIFFYNSAVRLTTQPSAVLPAIKDLALQGTEVLTCGLSLEHFSLTGQLKVGRKSNMYELLNIIGDYGSVIYL